jgi:hypothetical protein
MRMRKESLGRVWGFGRCRWFLLAHQAGASLSLLSSSQSIVALLSASLPILFTRLQRTRSSLHSFSAVCHLPVSASQGRLLSRNPALAPFNRQIIESAPSSAPPILYITTRNDPVNPDRSWIRIQTHMRQPPRYLWIPLNSPKHLRQRNHNNPTSSLRPHPPMPNLLKLQTVLHNYHARSS